MRTTMTSGKSRHGLRREIVLALAVKLVILIAIYFAFFAPDSRPAIDTATVTHAILGPGDQASSNKGAQ